jgi:hypothetical protein
VKLDTRKNKASMQYSLASKHKTARRPQLDRHGRLGYSCSISAKHLGCSIETRHFHCTSARRPHHITTSYQVYNLLYMLEACELDHTPSSFDHMHARNQFMRHRVGAELYRITDYRMHPHPLLFCIACMPAHNYMPRMTTFVVKLSAPHATNTVHACTQHSMRGT